MTGNERVKKVIQWLISQDIVENQKDLAQKIGYNSTTISHIISGVKSVSNKFVQNLCSLSDKVNPNYLLSDDPVMIFADDRLRVQGRLIISIPFLLHDRMQNQMPQVFKIRAASDRHRRPPCERFSKVRYRLYALPIRLPVTAPSIN